MANPELSKEQVVNAEKSPRPTSQSERAPTQSETDKQEVIDNELAMVESITDRLRESYRSKLPDIKSGLSKDERIDLAELFDKKAELANKFEDSGSNTLAAAEAKLDVYYKIMAVVDSAARRVTAEQEDLAIERSKPAPKGGESFVQKAEESYVEKDSATNWVENTPDRSEPDAEAAEVEEEEPSVEEVEEKDDTTQAWEKWLDDNESTLVAMGAVANGFVANKEALMQATGLDEEGIVWLEGVIGSRETFWKAEADKILKDAKANGFVNDVNVWTGSPSDVRKKHNLDENQYAAVMKRISPALDRKAA